MKIKEISHLIVFTWKPRMRIIIVRKFVLTQHFYSLLKCLTILHAVRQPNHILQWNSRMMLGRMNLIACNYEEEMGEKIKMIIE